MTIAPDRMASTKRRRPEPTSEDGVILERQGRILRITLNRTMALNAIDTAMASRLNTAWRGVRDDPGIDAVLLTSAGTEAFSIGFDRTDRPSIPVTARDCGVDKRLVVAVKGVACREALLFVQEADVVIASTHARFFGPLAGYEPGARDVGCAAKSGFHRPVNAEQAAEVGLADYIVPLTSLQDCAAHLAGIQ